MLALLLLPLNFAISWLNAWSCGKTWTESKANGGFPHFLNWMGAIMSASGFTWCYLLIFGFMAAHVPVTNEETGISAPLLTMEQVQVFFDLGYMVIIIPILGSGLALTVHSWGVAWRRRSLGSAIEAGWNTYASLHNFYSAVEYLPQAKSNVLGFFSGGGSSGDSDDAKSYILILALAAVLAGILTAVSIVKYTARKTALERRLRYESQASV